METPCRKICVLDEGGICTGCGRTIDEIVGWIEMTDAERADVMARVAQSHPDPTKNKQQPPASG